MQSFSSTGQATPGSLASFAIWVWSTKAAATNATVTAHVGHAAYVGTPSFTVCPLAHGGSCYVGNVPSTQAYELQLTVDIGTKASPGDQVRLSATASARNAISFTSSATDVVSASPTGSSSSPPVNIGLPTSLPPIAGTGTSPSNPAGLFPTVFSSPSPGSVSPPVKPNQTIHAADVAASVPLDSPLIGGQLAGLAVLAAAIMIALVRLSLRAPKPVDQGTRSPE